MPAPPDDQTRQRLCQEWLAAACRRLRAHFKVATHQRHARAAEPSDAPLRDIGGPDEAELAAAEDAVARVNTEADARGVRLPMQMLTEQHGLDELDQRILTLVVAPHIDVDMRDAVARFNDNLLANTVDLRLCLEFLFDDPVDRLTARARFGADAPLRSARLIVLKPSGDRHADNLLDQEIAPAARALQLLLGEQGLLDTAMAGMAVLSWPTVDLATLVLPEGRVGPLLSLIQHHQLPTVQAQESALFALPAALVVEISGPPGTGKTLLVQAIAHYLGRPLLEIDASQLATHDDADVAREIHSALDQARLSDALLVLDGVDTLCGKGTSRLGLLQDAFAVHTGIVVLTSRDTGALDPLVDRFVVQRLVLETPAAADRARIFRMHKPERVAIAADCDIDVLAGQYAFPGALIRNAMQVAVNRAVAANPLAPLLSHEILRRACQEQVRASLDAYAVRRQHNLTLADLVVPRETRTDIEELFAAAKYRGTVLHQWGFGQKLSTGKGLIALLSGEPGTGKTLCATILARELDRPLFQISVPRVVSKWVGETEKNIEQIFASARAAHGMLLFDEADSLFASRTKGDSAADRYSNMATNVLLQEIENFDGIALLTTNLEKHIDKAFQRRIGFKLHFPFPDAAARGQIWRTLIPQACPVEDDVDWADLGERFELSGGHIKNAVLRAAYQAASAGATLGTRHLEFAARQECKNAGKVFRSAQERDD